MKKRITIKINDGHQIYDILNKTYLVGRSREGMTGYSPELISSIKASEDDEDLNQIKRSCMDAVATLKTYLAEYIEEGTTEASNVLSFGETVLVLLMPSNYNEAATDAIAQLCHKFITNKVCFEWFTLTNPSEIKVYADGYEAAYAELRQAVSKRKRPVPPSGHKDIPNSDPEPEPDPEDGDENGPNSGGFNPGGNSDSEYRPQV